MEGRRFATRDELAGAAREAFGAGRRLVGVTRLRGGSKKGVYRLTFDDAGTAIVYLWSAAENYWPDSHDGVDRADVFSPAFGFDLFQAAHDRLRALGVRCPRIVWADSSRRHRPDDIAVVEDTPGETLQSLLRRDPVRAVPVLDRLAGALEVMHGHDATRFGKVAVVERGGSSHGVSCEQVVLDRAYADLAETARRDRRMAAAHDVLADVVAGLAAAVGSRSRYGLVHGELGPDHVLVDGDDQPVLIDIEGLMYFDVEWEAVFLRIRFGERYARLRRDGLDPHRLALYTLAMHLSLVAGPLRLLDGDFPDQGFMRGIVEHHLAAAVAHLGG